jgi:nucleoside-diphosphate-sugar epimerase
MKVLVTGGAGFIGSHLVDALRKRPHNVRVVDRNAARSVDLLHPGAFAGEVDRFEPQVVVHLAAQVGRLFGEHDVRHTVRTNAEVTATVARTCGERNIPVMYASTSEIYGDQADAVCHETRGPFSPPHNLYGLTKRWGEEVLALYLPDHMVTALRFSMPYGPGVPPGRGRAALPNILWQAHNRLPIPIHRGAERSWCWIGDTVRAVVTLLEGGVSGPWNIGRDDDPRLLRDLAVLACDMTGADPALIEDVDPPAAQTVVKRLSTARLRDLGWRPTVDVEEGMARVLEWVSRFDRDGKLVAEGVKAAC